MINLRGGCRFWSLGGGNQQFTDFTEGEGGKGKGGKVMYIVYIYIITVIFIYQYPFNLEIVAVLVQYKRCVSGTSSKITGYFQL